MTRGVTPAADLSMRSCNESSLGGWDALPVGPSATMAVRIVGTLAGFLVTLSLLRP
jgi:hypothetical protein